MNKIGFLQNLLHGVKKVLNAAKTPETKPAPATNPQAASSAATGKLLEKERWVGAIMPFDGYNWRVLDVKGNSALIISEQIIEQCPYNEKYEVVTWETCYLRKYLNGKFYANFTKKEQGRIAETRVSNPDNLWYGTKGGADTTDKIFLLSLEEADKYFGDSGDYREKRRKEYKNGKYVSDNDGFCFSNAGDSDRIAMFENKALWWWLRSPGYDSRYAADVNYDGGVNVVGNLVYGGSIGLRPALWLNLKS